MKSAHIESRRVDLWVADVDDGADRVRIYAGLLSPEEVTRSGRFRDRVNRNRFVVRHGILRCLLSGYLHCDPRKVEIHYGSKGKPYLAEKIDGNSLQFSMSHSGRLALFAVGRFAAVGVDIEEICEFPEMREIAGKNFCTAEIGAIERSPESGRCQLFYNLWVRKEAVLKASGYGLSLPLDLIDVSTQRGGSAAWSVRIRQGVPEGEFCLTDLNVAPGFAAALAVATSTNELTIVYRPYLTCRVE